MLDKIIDLDKQLFIYLNGLGSESFDGFWLIITKQIYWTPLFLLLLYVIYKEIGIKQTAYLILFVIVLVTITDQGTNFFKHSFQRLRPCNNPEIKSIIRIVQERNSYSFFSGHAANTMAVATFLYILFRKQFKSFYFLFLWPLIFAYSRIYLGLHYPLDIFTGYLFGMITGYLMFRIYQLCKKRYFPQLL